MAQGKAKATDRRCNPGRRFAASPNCVVGIGIAPGPSAEPPDNNESDEEWDAEFPAARLDDPEDSPPPVMDFSADRAPPSVSARATDGSPMKFYVMRHILGRWMPLLLEDVDDVRYTQLVLCDVSDLLDRVDAFEATDSALEQFLALSRGTTTAVPSGALPGNVYNLLRAIAGSTGRKLRSRPQDILGHSWPGRDTIRSQ